MVENPIGRLQIVLIADHGNFEAVALWQCQQQCDKVAAAHSWVWPSMHYDHHLDLFALQ
jgi:hypothetical protein